MVDALLDILGTTFELYTQALLAHWNVEGPGFFELHKAFRKLYERRQDDLDRIAERVRALKETIAAPGEGAKLSIGSDTDGVKLCRLLLDSHEKAAAGVRDAYAAAEEERDIATAMLLEELALGLEKDSWMLRSYGARRSP